MSDLTTTDNSSSSEQPMTLSEAKAKDTLIVQSATDLGRQLLEMHDRQGWKALKRASWEDYLQDVAKRTELNRATLYRRMQVSRVNSNLSQVATNLTIRLPKIAGSHAEILATLTNEEQVEAVVLAQEIAADYEPKGVQATFHHLGKILTSHYQQAVKQIQAKRPEETKPVPEPEVEDEFIFPAPATTKPLDAYTAKVTGLTKPVVVVKPSVIPGGTYYVESVRPTPPPSVARKPITVIEQSEQEPELLCYVKHTQETVGNEPMLLITGFDGVTYYNIPFRESYLPKTGTVPKDAVYRAEGKVIESVAALVKGYRAAGFQCVQDLVRDLCDVYDDLILAAKARDTK